MVSAVKFYRGEAYLDYPRSRIGMFACRSSGIGDLDLGVPSSDQIEPVCAVDFRFLSAFRSPQEPPTKSGGFARLSRASASLGGDLLLAILAWKEGSSVGLWGVGEAIYW